MAEHGVELLQFADTGAQVVWRDGEAPGELENFMLGFRQEFMERRIEQADGDGQARHDFKELDEILALHGENFIQRFAAGFHGFGKNHLAHGADALGAEEHVFGAAEANAFGAEIAGGAGFVWRFGIGADFHAARSIGPFKNRCEIAGEHRLLGGDAAPEDAAGGAINGDRLAFFHDDAERRHGSGFVIDAEATGPHYAGFPHAAGNHGCMGEKPAARGENAFGGVHALNILGAGFAAHKNAGAVAGFQLLGFGGIKHHLPRHGAGRGGKAGHKYLVSLRWIKRGMKELVQHQRINTQDRLLLREQAFAHHVHQGFEFNPGADFGGLALQQPELVLLDGEGDFLDGFAAALDLAERRLELGGLLWKFFREGGRDVWIPRPV